MFYTLGSMMVTIMLLLASVNAPKPQAQGVVSMAPDMRLRSPVDLETQAGTVSYTDRQGQVFVIARAREGEHNTKVVVITGGRIVAVAEGTYGAPGTSIVNGYPTFVSVTNADRNEVLYFRLDERYGFDQLHRFEQYAPIVGQP